MGAGPLAEELLRALALVLVIEGLLPFLSPSRWRQALIQLIGLEDRHLRAVGLGSMLAGLVLLQFVAAG